MGRRRLSVALLVPRPWATEVDGLRRGFGDRAIQRIPPHITLIPPVNVAEDDLADALALLRRSASRAVPFDLTIGPPETFLPRNPVVYLSVDDGHHGPLHSLKQALAEPPFDRPDARPYVPHVTIATGTTAERIEATMTSMADFRIRIHLDGLHLLEMVPDDRVGTRWIPIADHAFEPRRIVARGGLEVELTRSTVVDPEAASFEECHHADVAEGVPANAGLCDDAVAGDVPVVCDVPVAGDVPVVIVARRRDEGVVGVARGRVSGRRGELESILVARELRGQGVGRHLLIAFEHRCAELAALR